MCINMKIYLRSPPPKSSSSGGGLSIASLELSILIPFIYTSELVTIFEDVHKYENISTFHARRINKVSTILQNRA